MAQTSALENLLGKKINGVRVTPISLKITAIFIVFLLLSNFASNFINLTLNRSEQLQLTKNFLVRDLKDMYVFASNQKDLFDQTQKDMTIYLEQIADRAKNDFKNAHSQAFGVQRDGSINFHAGDAKVAAFGDKKALDYMTSELAAGRNDGAVEFDLAGQHYFGVFRYSEDWQTIMVRAEETNEFYEPSLQVFYKIALIILGFTLVTVIVGIVLIRYILRYVSRITDSIMKMQAEQSLDKLIDMKGASNDEVSYLGIAMNSLSATINNLLTIFKKFVARDIADQAYKEREIRLEGKKRELTILFSDIKSFTYMTETLGTGIIDLLNVHYNKAIRHIHDFNGDIGSIIGDAVLAIFGALPKANENKSLQALKAGYEVLATADSLRREMEKRKEDLIRTRGYLTDPEERVYKAVLLEVGVGIDGGSVFYGNIGSNDRMVNTVIGDNVNSASRLEGLTRVYKVPMIVSEYVRDEVMRSSSEYHFLELDQVQVKGKTIGKRVFFAIPQQTLTGDRKKECDNYEKALKAYYDGDWKTAHDIFSTNSLPPAEIFTMRTTTKKAPEGWNGIWTMQEK